MTVPMRTFLYYDVICNGNIMSRFKSKLASSKQDLHPVLVSVARFGPPKQERLGHGPPETTATMNDHHRDEAIDYRKLYLQEKQEALRRRRKTEEEKQRAAAIPLSNSSAAITAKVDAVDDEQEQQNAASSALLASRYSPLSVNALCRRRDRVDATGVFYKARFLADIDFQAELLRWLQGLPANDNKNHDNDTTSDKKEDEEWQALGRWTFLPHAQRRVALFDARRRPIPPPLQIVVDAVAPYFVASTDDDDEDDDESPALIIPNHLLINEYEPHQGIMAHTDGPAYAPRTATISLGRGAVLLQFTPTTAAGGNDDDDDDDHRPEQQTFQVVLQGHGSLVLFENAAYSSLQHSIREHCTVEHADATCRNADDGATVRRDYRISITIRHKY